jgi:hypothetical protein
MLQSIKHLFGDKLGASDGEIGSVKDFYFDDQNWAVRYVIADTGNWLSGRQVLLSPHAFGSLKPVDKILPVNLTRKQIEHSPLIELHKPVSRQFEEEYHRYYGWPYYWEGDGLWGGMRGFPVLETPPKFASSEAAAPVLPKAEHADPHLRSAQAVTGYHLETTDGIVGHVCDFMVDAKSWAIGQLVIKIGNRFTGKEVRLPVGQVDRISFKQSTVFVKLTKEAVEKSPEYRFLPNGAAVPGESTLAL